MFGRQIAPIIGTSIDRARDFTQGICICQFPVGHAFTNFYRAETVGNIGGTYGTGRFGPVRSHTDANDRTLTNVYDDGRLPTDAATIMCIYAKRDTTNRVAGLFGFEHSGGSASDLMSVHAPYSDGNVYFDYSGNVNGTSRVIASGQTWTAFVPSVWFFTTGPRGMEIWRDGVKLASNSATPVRVPVGTTFDWRLGCHRGTNSDLVDYYGVVVWKHQIEIGAIELLTKNPYAVLAPPTPMFLRKAPSAVAGRRRQLVNPC